MEQLLKDAEERYPYGTYFLSASGKLKSPLKVTKLKIAENYKNTIVETEGGIIYTNGKWADLYYMG
jgi:hypothetical protein